MRYIIYTLAIAFLSISHTVAQSSFVTAPSASVSSTGKQSSVPINYNNGTANFNIPIHTISEYGLNLPISLSYQTGGIQVDQLASNVGLGWTLNAGGGVFREVRGLPDEYYNEIHNRFGYLQRNSNAAISCTDQYCEIDSEPDIFYFNLNGASGSFFFDETGSLILKSKSDIKIEWNIGTSQATSPTGYSSFNQINTINSSENILTWKITTSNGTIYNIGDSNINEYHEIHTTYFSKLNQMFCNLPYEENCFQGINFLNGWFIKSIQSTTLHEVSFDYEIEQYFDLQNAPQEIWIDQSCNIDQNTTDDYILNDFPDFFSSHGMNINVDFIRSSRLIKINSPTTIITFKGEEREDLLSRGIMPLDLDASILSGRNKPKTINQILISKRSQSQTANCFKIFNLKHEYFISNEHGFNGFPQYVTFASLNIGDHDLKRLKLLSLEERSCDGSLNLETTFEYHFEDQMTRRLSTAKDYWGFNNGKTDNKTLIPELKFESTCIPSLTCSLNNINYFGDRNPSLRHTMAGALKSIKYPNGYFTEFEYELNTIRAKDHNSGKIYSRPVGGLRVKSITDNENSRVLNYDGTEKFEETSSISIERKELRICERCNNSADLTDSEQRSALVPEDYEDSCLDNRYDNNVFSYNCGTSGYINLNIEVRGCQANSPNAVHVKLLIKGPNNFEEYIDRYFPNTYQFSSENIGLGSLGLIPGYSYSISLENLSAHPEFKVNASATVILSHSTNVISSQEGVSTGHLSFYPVYASVLGSPEGQDTYFNEECHDGLVFSLRSSPISLLSGLNGGIVTYGRVEEALVNNPSGAKVYYYSTKDNEVKRDFYENLIIPELPIHTSFPAKTQMSMGPRFGLLKKIEFLNNSNAIVQSSTYDYQIHQRSYPFLVKGSYLGCTNGVEDYDVNKITWNRLRSFSIQMIEETKYLDGVTSIIENEYDSRFHYNITKKTLYAQNKPDDAKVINYKYAHELSQQNLIDRNFVSTPLEVIIDDFAGGGSKNEFTINTDGQLLNHASYSARTDGTWKLNERILSWNSDGLPTLIKKRASLNTEYTWDNGLLTEIKYGNMIDSYSYDALRRLISSTDNANIETIYQKYDGFHRLMKKSSLNGRITTSYEYFINPDSNDKEITTSTFNSNSYPIADRITEREFDFKGRLINNNELNFTQSGSDYRNSNQYNTVGLLELSCDPNQGGCTIYSYEESPLGRLIESTPAGSAKTVKLSYGSNTEAIAGYPVGSLYKSSITDEDGLNSISYSDIFGRSVATVDALGQMTTSTYNDRDQVLEVVPPGSSTGNTNLNFSYSYYSDGLLESSRVPDKDAADFFYYDPNTDALIQEDLSNGHILTYTLHPDHPNFVENVKLDGQVIKEFTPYFADLSTYWIGESKTKILGESNMLSNIYTYDDVGRVLTEHDEYHQGHSDFTYTYDDMANVRTTQRVHQGVGGDAFTLDYNYDFDKGLRPIKTVGTYPDVGSITQHELSYNDNDWLTAKTIGGGIQTIDYGYTGRGWLKSINKIADTYLEDEDPCNEPPDDGPTTPDDCEKILSRTPALEYKIAISYNCEKIRLNLATAVNIDIETLRSDTKAHVSTRSLQLPLNGFALEREEDTDTQKELYEYAHIHTGDMTTYVVGLIEDCMNAYGSQVLNEANLHQVRQGVTAAFTINSSSDAKVFAQEIYYESGNNDLEADARYNGNIAWMKWRVRGEAKQAYGFQYDDLNRLLQAKYGNDLNETCDIKKQNWYDVTISEYDPRGNIGTITRNGAVPSEGDIQQYDQIDALSMSYDGNKLTNVSDGALAERGYNTSGGSYDYQNGNLVSDSGNGITNVVYNYLDQPTEITSTHGTVTILYDANGRQLKLTQSPTDEPTSTYIYHAGIEYKDGKRESIASAEGRVVYNSELETVNGTISSYMEWMMADHLGNTRVRFVDKDGDGSIRIDDEATPEEYELVSSYHYYPFGMKMQGTFTEHQGVNYKYQYNGIEHMDFLGHGISLAGYRIHDAAVGRWWQVDPKGNQASNWSSYNAMFNNPIGFSDPNGDFPFPFMSSEQSMTSINGLIKTAFNSPEVATGDAEVIDSRYVGIEHMSNSPFSGFLFDKGGSISAGEYKLYSGLGTLNSGHKAQVWVARKTTSRGFQDDFVISLDMVKEFLSKRTTYFIIAQTVDMGLAMGGDPGSSYWDQVKKGYTPEAILTGITIFGGGILKSPKVNVATNTSSAAKGGINPKNIHFMQSSIKNTTGNYTVLGNAEALSNGSLNPNVLRMNVWKDTNGKIWSLDNRRLGAFRLSTLDEAPVNWATPPQVRSQMWKMTTKTGGVSIRLKLGGGKNMIIK